MTIRDLTPEQIEKLKSICRAQHANARQRWGDKTPPQDKVWELAFSRGLEAGLALLP